VTVTVSLKVSAAAAALLAPTADRQEKLGAARGEASLPPGDQATVLLYLCHDRDGEIQRTALQTVALLTDDQLAVMLAEEQLHPRVLDLFARRGSFSDYTLFMALRHPQLLPETAAFLRERYPEAAPAEEFDLKGAPEGDGAEPDTGDEDVEVPVEEDEEYLSKYQMAQTMGTGEKIKMALTGDKEWRSIFLKDANKLVSSAVIKNPRITDAEVLAVCKSTVQNDEIIRLICANKEWVKNYQIRKALVENHKTPLPAALRFLPTLGEKDVATLAKSKNISSVISTQARRMLMNKKK
jgi:hypothetical protein